MKDTDGYAVFLFPQAIEALGDAVKPYITEGANGAHVLCTEIDTAGSLIEMSLDGTTEDGQALQVELMVPSSMVRMIVSARGEDAFGFRPRAAATATPIRATPVPATPSADAASPDAEPTPPVE